MTPEHFQQIEELYHAARERTAEERAELLAQVDPELRREVESLLAQRASSDFLDRPAIQNAPQLLGDSTLTGIAVGTSLGPYRIEKKLGEGGMGEVFRAVDTRLGRAVAVKIAQKQFIERFEREARAISSLNHPHICTLYDVGPNYLVMELVDGETIAARLKGGPLPVKEALLYALQILSALTEAHEKGIIHRDLKPGNIMIAKSGAKVLDFGLAKSGQDETITASHMAMGTPAYMAPEQRQGKPADARADIYSFGCVLYEMLTGARVGSQQRRIPSPKLERIVNRCLEEDPGRRWPSAAELERELAGAAGASQRKLIVPAAGAIVALLGATYFYLHRAPKLTERDTIVLADFDNKTGEPVFDDTLRQGLAVQLRQSPFLSLISDQKIRQTLQLMGKPPDQKLTAELTREVCERTGSAAMLTGSIASLGTRYVLGLRAVTCSTGDTLDEQVVESDKKEGVLDAVSDMAGKFRARTGESLVAIQQNNIPLREATTSSLEALKAYTDALKGRGSGYEIRAVPLLKRATEIDPQFASAWADLALAYSDLGEQELARVSTANAYKWRDRTSSPEKFHIAYVYDRNVTGNLEKAWQTVSLWRQTYPRDALAFDLSAGYAAQGTGRYREAIKFAEMAMTLDPGIPTAAADVVGCNLYLDRFDEASKAIQRHPDTNPGLLLIIRYYLAFFQGDQAEMDKVASESKQSIEVEEVLDHSQALLAAQAGRLKDADRLSRSAVDLAHGAGAKERAATWVASQAVWNAFYGNAAEARQRAEMALKMATGRDLKYAAAFAFASAHEFSRSQALGRELDKAYPEDTQVQNGYLPALRGLAAIGAKDPQRAVDLLQANSPYEFGVPPIDFNSYFGGLYPVYVRGLAYLAMNRGAEAATEFQKILDHKGLTAGDPVSAMAQLQLARARRLAGDTAKATAAYQQFLNRWKDADPDIPIYKQAKAEYAKLQ